MPEGRLRRLTGGRSAGPQPENETPVELPPEREQLHRILDAMSDAVLVVDTHGRVSMANPAAERVLGVSLDGLVGSTLRKAVGSAGLDRVVSEAAQAGARAEDEVELVWPSRRRLHVRAASLSAGGGVVAVVTDVTRTRMVEQMRRDFVANVSHELKTPVSAITLLAESLSLALEAGHTDEAKRFAERLSADADRLRNLAVDLLALSRVESFDVPAQEPVDVAVLVADTAERLRPEAEHKGVKMDSRLGKVPIVQGGKDDYRALVQNVVENAVRYTDVGSVTLSLREADHAVILEVKDTGIGIPAKDRKRVFERFYRVDRSRDRDTGGTGLGLAIVKHIAEAYGLDVKLTSKEDVGTTVRVRFPA
jgi:PAS domain S-box-containing protein